MVEKVDTTPIEINNMGKLMLWFRKQNGLTQEELAELIGLSRSQIGNIETGRSDGSNKAFIALLDVMGVSIVPDVHDRDKTEGLDE